MPISGVQQPTLQSAALIDGKLTASEDLPAVLKNRTDLGDGDGTVTKVSAIPLERSQELDNFFIAEQHGGLQNQAQVLDNLLNTLRMSQYNLSEIGLSLDDLYLANESITMRARLVGLPNSATKLKADIESVSGDRAALSLDFAEQEKEWILMIDDLQPGLYRVRIRTENNGEQSPTLVHDLFEVVRQ
jgi:hypothetical protein